MKVRSVVSDAHEAGTHEYDAGFTPFMLRVRAVLDGAENVPTTFDLRTSELQPRATVIDAWFYLRARSEQIVAEANSMLERRAPLLQLVDEAGTGRLAFTVGHGTRWFVLRVEQVERQAFIELESSMTSSDAPLEPVDKLALDDLVVALLADIVPRKENPS